MGKGSDHEYAAAEQIWENGYSCIFLFFSFSAFSRLHSVGALCCTVGGGRSDTGLR